MHEEVLAKRRAILGDDHPSTLTSMHNLALTYGEQGKMTEAAKMNEEVLAKYRAILGDDHPYTLMSMHNLAETFRQQGKLTEAAEVHEEVLAKRRAILGDDHPDTLMSMHNLALTYRTLRKTGRGREDAGGRVGEMQGDLGRRSSVHAHEHEQPSLDVRRSRENDRGRKHE